MAVKYKVTSHGSTSTYTNKFSDKNKIKLSEKGDNL